MVLRLLVCSAGGILSSLYILGRYIQKTDLDYCPAAMRLRWLVRQEEKKQKLLGRVKKCKTRPLNK